MNQVTTNPRSTLHALTPYREGTPDVESLLSYFCRLAVSHSVSTTTLSRTITEHFTHEVSSQFNWHQRQIAGIRESAFNWSAALSALTSVQDLDRLTFLPWRDVISQNGLSIATKGQFCPNCFAQDREQGHSPYFRLAWEAAEVTMCLKHRRPLLQHCPDCGKDNCRHAASLVVPGWCTHCGAFLGQAPESATPPSIEPGALWRARQVGELLAYQSSLSVPLGRNGLVAGITQLIADMDNGQSAAFARRIGLGKSTVHHWLKTNGTPTLAASLAMASQCGISLRHLLTGDLVHWRPPTPERQLTLMLPRQVTFQRSAPRRLDWDEIEVQLKVFLDLPTPITVLEAARRLQLEARQLYLRANRTTRQLGERWKTYQKRRHENIVAKAWPYLEAACTNIWAEGKAVTRREIAARVPADILATVPHLFDVLKEVQAHMERNALIEEANKEPASLSLLRSARIEG